MATSRPTGAFFNDPDLTDEDIAYYMEKDQQARDVQEASLSNAQYANLTALRAGRGIGDAVGGFFGSKDGEGVISERQAQKDAYKVLGPDAGQMEALMYSEKNLRSSGNITAANKLAKQLEQMKLDKLKAEGALEEAKNKRDAALQIATDKRAGIDRDKISSLIAANIFTGESYQDFVAEGSKDISKLKPKEGSIKEMTNPQDGKKMLVYYDTKGGAEVLGPKGVNVTVEGSKAFSTTSPAATPQDSVKAFGDTIGVAGQVATAVKPVTDILKNVGMTSSLLNGALTNPSVAAQLQRSMGIILKTDSNPTAKQIMAVAQAAGLLDGVANWVNSTATGTITQQQYQQYTQLLQLIKNTATKELTEKAATYRKLATTPDSNGQSMNAAQVEAIESSIAQYLPGFVPQKAAPGGNNQSPIPAIRTGPDKRSQMGKDGAVKSVDIPSVYNPAPPVRPNQVPGIIRQEPVSTVPTAPSTIVRR
jgi:hypothetical protein